MEATNSYNAILERYSRAKTNRFPIEIYFGQKLEMHPYVRDRDIKCVIIHFFRANKTKTFE